jgi:hypothetical protein
MPCWRGLHGACNAIYVEGVVCDCDHKHTAVPAVGSFKSQIGRILNLDDPPTENQKPDSPAPTRRLKDDQSVTDPQSTGRKRAAKLYPLRTSTGDPIPCDLAGKKAPTLPGYYKVQIDGCGVRQGSLAANAQSRHHWSYNTLDNERSNIGLLCHSCHNLIHARNDEYKAEIYETLYGFKPKTEDLQWANKALKSGVVGGGQIDNKESTLNTDKE